MCLANSRFSANADKLIVSPADNRFGFPQGPVIPDLERGRQCVQAANWEVGKELVSRILSFPGMPEDAEVSGNS